MASKALIFARSQPAFVGKKFFSTSSVRNGHAPPGSAPYRCDVPPCDYGPKIKLRTALQTVVWCNIFYSFWYSPELFIGHPLYQPPNPKLWTDEELGIPPDDYDEVIEAGKAFYVRSA